MLLKNNCATLNAVKGCASGMKCAYLVSLSTTTKITSNPPDLGSPSIKSMLMVDHGCDGIGRGCSKPGVLTCSDLACWQTEQLWTYEVTDDFKLGHANNDLTL